MLKGSNELGHADFDQREQRALFRSYGCLLRAAKAENDQSRDIELNLASLYAPLGRSCSENEAILEVHPFDGKPGWEKANEFGGDRSSHVSMMDDGEPIIDSKYKYFELDNAWVTPRGHVCHKNALLMDQVQATAASWADGHAHPYFYANPPFRAFDPETRTCVVKLNGDLHNKEAFLFATENAAANFGHFIHDTLLQYPLYRELLNKFPNMLCLMAHDFKYPVQQAIITELFKEEIKEGRMRKPDIEGGYRKLIVPIDQFRPFHNIINIDAAINIRKTLSNLARNYPLVDTVECDKIFVSRRDGTSAEYGRSQLPHDKIEAQFTEMGYRVVSVSDMSIPEIMFTFSRARVVAGIHGAGLLNIMFSMYDDAELIELDTVIPGWASIERICKSSGVKHRRIRPAIEGGNVYYNLLDLPCAH